MSPSLRWVWGGLLGLGLCGGALSAQDAVNPAGKEAPGAPVVHPGPASAADAATKDGALVLLVFESESSPDCREFDRKTLTSPTFKEKTGLLHVVYVDVDASPKTAALFEVRAVPDLVLMTGEMKIVSHSQGVMSAEDLVKWVEQGRRLAARGMWQGNSFDPAAVESAGASPEELKRLVQSLGEGETQAGQAAALALEALRDRAVPHLIDGLADPYLGVRIGSGEVLRKLAPAAPPVDPWEAAETRGRGLTEMRQWWVKIGTLPPPVRADALAPEEMRSAEEAVTAVLSSDAVRRTRGMSLLVRLGAPVLPRLREAIRKCAESGDQNTLRVLEDVRWAILVPDPVEMKAGVRRDLARGTSENRQNATGRLGGHGTAALPALRELVDDADPLVRESTLNALRQVGGTDSLAAMAVLLKANDSNLRMVAAQTLGRSKNARAADYLATAVQDADEVVACVAIAGLEEIKAKNQQGVLISCLKDKRWRVRAAAAEVIGKMSIETANKDLLALLSDEDAFVVKSALTALRSTKGTPNLQMLLTVIQRTPSVTSLAVECAINQDTPAVLKMIESVYDQTEDRRGDIMDGLAESSHDGDKGDEHWLTLLTKVAGSNDAGLRHKLVHVLDGRSPQMQTRFLAGLLGDSDPDIRVAAAGLTLEVAAFHWGVSGDDGKPDYGLLSWLENPASAEKSSGAGEDDGPPRPRGFIDKLIGAVSGERTEGTAVGPAGERDASTLAEPGKATAPGKPAKSKQLQRAEEIKQLHQHWHDILKVTLEKRQDLSVATAFYVTGDGRTDLPPLSTAFDRKELNKELDDLDYYAVALLLKRLPWPEGKDFVEHVCRQSPFVYSEMVQRMRYASKPLREYLAQPDRIVAAVETAKGQNLASVASLLFEERSEGLSLYTPTKSNQELLRRLCDSKVPAARAIGVFAAGSRGVALPSASGETNRSVLDDAMEDDSPPVRCAAIHGVVAHVSSQLKREEQLSPMLADNDPTVTTLAAWGMLDRGLRAAVDLPVSQYLYLEDSRVRLPGRYRSSGSSEAVLSTIDRKPAFLDVVRGRLGDEKPKPTEEESQAAEALTVLLAQYGDFSGLDKALREWEQNPAAEPSNLLLVGLALTKDVRYLAPFRKLVEKEETSWRLRDLLKWLSGVRGEEARELRREINRRIQAAD
jgi:HEAT repeat protein